MKFLIDNQLPGALAHYLRKRGFDCKHVLEVGLANASDSEICRFAIAEQRVIVSKDQDFLYPAGRPDGGITFIWVRLSNFGSTVRKPEADCFPQLIIQPDVTRMTMTIEEMVLAKLRSLPPERQKAVLHFVESLTTENGVAKPLRSLEGFLEDLGVDITEEDIAAARREMWGEFPGDIS